MLCLQIQLLYSNFILMAALGMTLPRKKSFRPPSVLPQPNTPQYHAEIRRPPDAVALCRAGESLIFRLRQAEIYLLLPKVLSVLHTIVLPIFFFGWYIFFTQYRSTQSY